MAHGICPGCKREFVRKGRGDFCTADCKEGFEERQRLGRDEIGKRMAKPPEDGSAEAEARKRRGEKQQTVEQSRIDKARGGVGDVLEQVRERTSGEVLGGEGLLITRVRAVGDAKRARDWPVLKGALVDLAAVAVSWASRIDAVDGEDPLPPAHTLVPAGEGLNGHGPEARSVAERYADLLLDAASGELPGPEARATIERLLGVGL